MPSVNPTPRTAIQPYNGHVVDSIDRNASKALAEVLLGLHPLRAKTLGVQRLNDAQWNMLLDLYVQADRNHEISVSSLGLASGAPQSTSLRLINQIEALGLIVLEDDPRDGRRRIVRLSDTARANLDRYLEIAMERLGQCSNKGWSTG